MKKLLLLIPVLELAACVQKSYTYEAFYDVEGTGKAEISLNALGKIVLKVKSDNQVTCKLRVEKEISNAGAEATCEYEITQDTDNQVIR